MTDSRFAPQCRVRGVQLDKEPMETGCKGMAGGIGIYRKELILLVFCG
jgi:hypothetical protein